MTRTNRERITFFGRSTFVFFFFFFFGFCFVCLFFCFSEPLVGENITVLLVHHRPCGAMDSASDFGSGGCEFESRQGLFFFFFFFFFCFFFFFFCTSETKPRLLLISFGYDHINCNPPVLIRTPKLTQFEPAQYWGGGPPGNSVVLYPSFIDLFFFFFFPLGCAPSPQKKKNLGVGRVSLARPQARPQDRKKKKKKTPRLKTKRKTRLSPFFFLLLVVLGVPRGYQQHSVGCARPRSLASQGRINTVILDSGTKIRLILKGASAPVSEIKLIRTDTTLDLSQKAEKV